MSTELSNCPNCGTALKSGMLSSVKLLSTNKIAVINEYHEMPSLGYCSKCGNELYNNYKTKVANEKQKAIETIQSLISAIPVISIQSPINWDYQILDLVTGQSTTGTGVISEFTSSFTDLFGTQSGIFNKKLKDGETMCYNQLRKQTIDMGGNAVIATDIDYSEVGGAKGMLMVCMAGTAIKLKNTDILGEKRAESLKTIEEVNSRITHLSTLKLDEV